MALKHRTKIDSRKRYIQIALNSTLSDAHSIISSLPISDRIILEAGTPIIKRYGTSAITQIKSWYMSRIRGEGGFISTTSGDTPYPQNLAWMFKKTIPKTTQSNPQNYEPYVVADMKMMDRGSTEVEIAAHAGADAVVALGAAPIESLNTFIDACEKLNVDAMIDMMNIDYPLNVLRKLKKMPAIVILHRGVDEEHFNKEKQLPLHEIRRIKGSMDMLIAIAGGDTIKEVQRSIFNDADIVIVWKSFYQHSKETGELAAQFLKEIK